MQVIGKKYLDSNFYNSITIHSDKIYIYSRDKIITIDSDSKFSDELKGKSKDEIIEMIIDHYLRNTKVCRIEPTEVLGTNGRKLKFDTYIGDNNKSKIIHKYQSDRLNHFYERDDSKNSIYSINQLSEYDGNKYFFLTKDNKVATFELEFLYEMIENMFKDEKVYMTSYDPYYHVDPILISMVDDTKVIEVSHYLMEICSGKICEMVSNHNDLIDKNKSKQLKLEV